MNAAMLTAELGRVQLPLDPDRNATHAALLEGIQGNILRGHGRSFTRLVLFRFRRPGHANRGLFPAAVQAQLVTTAAQQRRDARGAASDPHRPFYGFGLSLSGMTSCGYGRLDLPWEGRRGFGESMCSRFRQLGDTTAPDAVEQPQPDWESAYIEEPHGVWLLANDDPSGLDAMQHRVERLLSTHDASVHAIENGRRWRDRDDPAHGIREPFGFLDDISQPEFLAGPAYEEASPWVRAPLTQVLFRTFQGGLHDGGSFLVLRKLEQNVKAFREFERAMAPELDRMDAAVRPRDAGALLIGRERDGTPLAETGRDRNDFDFGRGAARCPFHAHIRKANPRVAMTNEGAPIEAQFVRRSSVYDSDGQLPALATADYPEGDRIEGRVGLLFLGYMSDIDNQFMTMQQNWFGSRSFPVVGTGLGDPLLRPQVVAGADGRPAGWSWSEQAMVPRALPEFVRPRGGAFFYVPSIAWLNGQAS